MSLKYKIDADAFGKLEEAQQALYSEKDGDYVLDVEGAEGKQSAKQSAKQNDLPSKRRKQLPGSTRTSTRNC
jgi:hypothetical protein